MRLDAVPLFLACQTVLFVLGALLAASVILSRLWQRSAQSKHLRQAAHLDELFVTARGAGTNWWVVGWSLMPGTGTGSWAVPVMGFYGYNYGLAGVISYSITVGLMPAVVAFLGLAAYKNIRRTQSLPASLRLRYGPVVEGYTLLIMLVSTGATLAQEYTALTTIVFDVLSIRRLVVIGVVAAMTTYYICFGGALVGLFTSQVYGLLSLATIIVLAGYCSKICRDYQPPSNDVMVWGVEKTATQWTFLGSVFGNATLAMFLELPWQKHICCRVPEIMRGGSYMAAVLITVFCIFWGLPGMMSAWKDAAEGTSFSGSSHLLYLDRSFQGTSLRHVWAPEPFWFGVAYLTVVAIISQTSINAFNNAFLSSLYGSLPRCQHRLQYSRAGALLLNAAALVMASFNLNLIGLVTIASMVSVTLGVPLFLSICSKRLHDLATAADILVSAVAGLLGCILYSYFRCRSSNTTAGDAMSASRLALESIKFSLYSNTFQWELVCTSVGAPLMVYCLMIASRLAYCWAVDAWHGRSSGWQFELVTEPSVKSFTRSRLPARTLPAHIDPCKGSR